MTHIICTTNESNYSITVQYDVSRYDTTLCDLLFTHNDVELGIRLSNADKEKFCCRIYCRYHHAATDEQDKSYVQQKYLYTVDSIQDIFCDTEWKTIMLKHCKKDFRQLYYAIEKQYSKSIADFFSLVQGV